MFALLGAVVLLSSCKKDNEDFTPVNSKSFALDASAFDKWIYFSFDADTIVEVADYATSLDWDIAFHRSNVRLNCGKSGKGTGGCISLGNVSFDAVKEAPEGIYQVDTIMKLVMSNIQPMVEVDQPGNILMSKWVSMVGVGMGAPTYTVNDYVYSVRTAKGRYAKMWLNGYTKDGKGGYITMKYTYQKDGSRKF